MMGVDCLFVIDDYDLIIELLIIILFCFGYGVEWVRDVDGNFIVVLMMDLDFYIVFKNYMGGFVEVDEILCLCCYEMVGKYVCNFEYGCDWYGRI